MLYCDKKIGNSVRLINYKYNNVYIYICKRNILFIGVCVIMCLCHTSVIYAVIIITMGHFSNLVGNSGTAIAEFSSAILNKHALSFDF